MTLYNVETIEEDLIQIRTDLDNEIARFIIVKFDDEGGSKEISVEVNIGNLKTLRCFLDMIINEKGSA